MPGRSQLPRLRKMCRALPGTTEVEAWGAPTFRAGKMYAMYAEAGNSHGGREAVWIKSDVESQRHLVKARPKLFFVPPYVGPYGWVGIYLDKRPNWNLIGDVLIDGYRSILAPAKGGRAR